LGGESLPYDRVWLWHGWVCLIMRMSVVDGSDGLWAPLRPAAVQVVAARIGSGRRIVHRVQRVGIAEPLLQLSDPHLSQAVGIGLGIVLVRPDLDRMAGRSDDQGPDPALGHAGLGGSCQKASPAALEAAGWGQGIFRGYLRRLQGLPGAFLRRNGGR
jgi:hypothetical protein